MIIRNGNGTAETKVFTPGSILLYISQLLNTLIVSAKTQDQSLQTLNRMQPQLQEKQNGILSQAVITCATPKLGALNSHIGSKITRDGVDSMVLNAKEALVTLNMTITINQLSDQHKLLKLVTVVSKVIFKMQEYQLFGKKHKTG